MKTRQPTYPYRLDTGETIHVPAVVSKVVYYDRHHKKITKAEYERQLAAADSSSKDPA